jgi:hypothetical protein
LLLSRNEPSPFTANSLFLPMVAQLVDGAATLFNTLSTALAGWTGCAVTKSHDRYEMNQGLFGLAYLNLSTDTSTCEIVWKSL